MAGFTDVNKHVDGKNFSKRIRFPAQYFVVRHSTDFSKCLTTRCYYVYWQNTTIPLSMLIFVITISNFVSPSWKLDNPNWHRWELSETIPLSFSLFLWIFLGHQKLHHKRVLILLKVRKSEKNSILHSIPPKNQPKFFVTLFKKALISMRIGTFSQTRTF